jgi:hypothetical protein
LIQSAPDSPYHHGPKASVMLTVVADQDIFM